DLFVAMIARLRAEARERFGAPLVVVHQLPDQALPPDGSEGREAMLRATFARLRRLDIMPVSVAALMEGTPQSQQAIVHDGHPTALTYGRIAGELKRILIGDRAKNSQ
ncbi:MAG: hypothetical protein AB7I59_27935, partial [Geminicoccaceae bacterium]